ncbi:5-methylcytosine rRNA methyltransferase NSUN4-like [Oppia nitens]|uniref:5-methylcytosine rRNA methyltransferase NSUN4-like n=1 Tax=Oppia nitens TaxID=1686743 RepID=UPI0023DB9C85|nr:5-methylcytosine rRNA methyltransferase NSUN4-like [Oppia nitens]
MKEMSGLVWRQLITDCHRLRQVAINCMHCRYAHWSTIRQKKIPKDIALQHFDNFYGKVYGNNWKSIRLGLLSPNKYCSVVNIFADYEDIEIKMRQLGAVDLRRYYERHHKKYTRMERRMKLLAEKKAKKIAMMAEEAGVDVSEINADDVVVSDISDRELGSGGSSVSDAEDLLEMLSQKEDSDDPFINAAKMDIDLNDFVPIEDLKYGEEIVTEAPYYEFYQKDIDIPIEHIQETKLEIPEILKIYSFPRGVMSNFPAPQRQKLLGVFDYFLMDGASILPVLALNIQPNDRVADYCAAPGGKSLIMALTLRPKYQLCNDLSLSRCSRLKNVFDTYIPEIHALRKTLEFSNKDAKTIIKTDAYDKVLVDVICTNDRLSVAENDNSWFKNTRLQERLRLPEEQLQMLYAGLRSVRPDGAVVYSTCSLSPIQNDGVVHMALKRIWEETNHVFVVCDLKEAFRPFRGLYKMNNTFKYGTQVVPFMPSNYGPIYISKLKRIQ